LLSLEGAVVAKQLISCAASAQLRSVALLAEHKQGWLYQALRSKAAVGRSS